MDDPTRILFGRLLAGAAIVGAAISVLLLGVLGRWDCLVEEFGLHNAIPAIGLGLIVWVALSTQPRNGAIWALAWSAFFGMLQAVGAAVTALYLEGDPGLLTAGLSPSEMPLGAALAQQTVTWTWIPSVFILITIWLLLFPDGRPLSPRWRWVGWFSVVLMTTASLSFAWITRPSSTVVFDSDPWTVWSGSVSWRCSFFSLPQPYRRRRWFCATGEVVGLRVNRSDGSRGAGRSWFW